MKQMLANLVIAKKAAAATAAAEAKARKEKAKAKAKTNESSIGAGPRPEGGLPEAAHRNTPLAVDDKKWTAEQRKEGGGAVARGTGGHGEPGRRR